MTTRPPLGRDLLRMSAKIFIGMLVFVLSVGVISALLGSLGAGAALQEARKAETLAGTPESDVIIREVKLVGPILSHAPESTDFFGGLSGGFAYGYEVKKQLEEAANDDAVKAVLLHVSTPGGTIVGSAAVDEGVKAVKAAGKPIVVYVDMLSASGGVWSTANADAIYADYGSIIGSVGVIFSGFMEFTDPVAMGGIFDSIETRGGIKMNTITAGKGKDFGNPFRPMTDDERAMLQAMNDEFYAKFVDHMVAGRKMDRDRLINEFGASVFSNDRAQELGYIDGSKNYQQVAEEIATRANLGNDWRVVGVEQKDGGLFGGMVQSLAWLTAPQAELARKQAETAQACKTFRMEASVISLPHLSQLCGG